MGTYTYQNGNAYSGEFRHGQRTGFGVLKIVFLGQSNEYDVGWKEPAVYVGHFKRGRLNGYGLLIASSGRAYAGTFKDNIPRSDLRQRQCRGEVSARWTNCIGTYHYPNGNVYRGEFAHGVPEGVGMLQVKSIGTPGPGQVRLPLPGVYVGRFRNGALDGKGVIVMNGAGYFGIFKHNMLEKPE